MTNEEWCYVHEGQSVGPFSKEKIISLMNSGALSRATLVRKHGAQDWQSIRDVFDLDSELPPPLAKLNELHTTSEAVIGWSDTTPRPWRRFFARLVDTVASSAIPLFFVVLIWHYLDLGRSVLMDDPMGRRSLSLALFDTVITSFTAIFMNAVFI